MSDSKTNVRTSLDYYSKRLGNVIRIVEKDSGNAFPLAQSNVLSSDVASFDNFRTIKKNYSMLVRFEIVD